jgi:nucleoside-diphosphate-sugar epimerase
MRVFLTGGAGLIGSHAARALLAAGCGVTALIRPGSSPQRLQDVLDRLTIVRGDLADLPLVRQALGDLRPDACLHLAWYAEPGKYLHAPQNVPALTVSLALLDELARAGCKQVVMTGTCAEYDTDVGYLREDGPTRPATIYAAAKLSLNLLGQQLAAAAGLRLAWARLFYLYGPGEDERRLVPAVIRALARGETFPATKGDQVRDYLHVEDVAAGLAALVRQGVAGVFNIASGVPVTVRQLMETIGEIMGRTALLRFGAVPYRAWEPRFICGDNQRLRALGWAPRYGLREGLAGTVDWWQQSGH